MNDAALFDEAFGQLDDPGRERLDLAAASDPALALRRSRLHRALDLLLDDDDPEPPADLAERTTARLLGLAQEPRILEFAPPRPRYRWADVGVAAAVMLIGLMSLVPAVHHQRQAVDRLACVNNLRQVGLALNQYASTFETYPYVDPKCPASYVGAAFVQLGDAGLLHDHSVLDCPCDGSDRTVAPMLGFAELLGREKQRPGTCRGDIRVDYAYHQGVRLRDGRRVPAPYDPSERIPLAADQPPFRLDEPGKPSAMGGVVLAGNSPNHGGAGQNVLYNDGHVDWRRTRWVSESDTDLFLNQHDEIGPGVHRVDAVLTPCVLRFQD